MADFSFCDDSQNLGS